MVPAEKKEPDQTMPPQAKITAPTLLPEPLTAMALSHCQNAAAV